MDTNSSKSWMQDTYVSIPVYLNMVQMLLKECTIMARSLALSERLPQAYTFLHFAAHADLVCIACRCFGRHPSGDFTSHGYMVLLTVLISLMP